MPTNIKKDPAVIEHVNNEVGKASVKAAKAETQRILKLVADAKAGTKELDKTVTKATVVGILNALVAQIKNVEATGGA